MRWFYIHGAPGEVDGTITRIDSKRISRYGSAMDNSMQTLGVVGRLFPTILSGQKTSTIRWHECRIVPGPMRYVCDDDMSKLAVVNVVRCTDMPLASVAAYLGRSDEWPDEVLLAGMREHYPEIELTDIVQVIEHEPFIHKD